jgi:hypothetical protein
MRPEKRRQRRRSREAKWIPSEGCCKAAIESGSESEKNIEEQSEVKKTQRKITQKRQITIKKMREGTEDDR